METGQIMTRPGPEIATLVPNVPTIHCINNQPEASLFNGTPQRVTGKDCRVSVDELSYQFDLSSLYNSENDYVVTTEDYKYTINVCKGLVSPTGKCTGGNVGGCQQSLNGEDSYVAGNSVSCQLGTLTTIAVFFDSFKVQLLGKCNMSKKEYREDIKSWIHRVDWTWDISILLFRSYNHQSICMFRNTSVNYIHWKQCLHFMLEWPFLLLTGSCLCVQINSMDMWKYTPLFDIYDDQLGSWNEIWQDHDIYLACC